MKPAELALVPKTTKATPMTLSFAYKRGSTGDIEERKSRASIQGNRMKPHQHFDPKCTSAPMVDRCATRMFVVHSVEKGWPMERFDIHSAFLHENYGYKKQVLIREMAKANGTFKHGKKVGILVKNQYGNPSGTFYYIVGLMEYLRKHGAIANEQEPCLVRMEFKSGILIAAIALDNFLVTASTTKAIYDFQNVMKRKYQIKRLGKPKRFLGWYFQYNNDGAVSITQELLSDKTRADVGMLHVNGTRKPYSKEESYYAPTKGDVMLPEKTQEYQNIIGNLRYLANSTRPDLLYVVGRLGASMATPSARHWKIMRNVMRYLKTTREHGLVFLRGKRNKKVKYP